MKSKNNNKPPDHLSKESQKLWGEIIAEYSIDDSAGLRILRAALEALDRAEMAREAINKQGMMFKDKWGQPKPHPLLPIERDSRAAFLAGIKQLNLDLEPLRDGPGRPPGR